MFGGTFYNRSQELAALARAWERPGGGQLALLYGRRRLGKTFLLQKFFSEGRPHCYYLADQAAAAVQRMELARQLLTALPDPGVAGPEEIAVSWNALLRHVSLNAAAPADSADTGRFALILDEFPYLVQESPELPSVLQAWWDREAVHRRLFVVLCGSHLSAMAALGEPTAPLYGRFNAGTIRLEPLRYDDVASFYAGAPSYGLHEKLILFGVFGGTPRYHAMVDTRRTLREALVELLLVPYAALENEVQFLLGSQSIRDPAPYNSVLRAIAAGATQFGDILNQSASERGRLSFYLTTLQQLGWVARELPFRETSERRALYRIADPFLHFWYRFAAPLASERQFSSDPYRLFDERIAPHLPDYMGRYVFEEICRQWLERHAEARLGLTIRKAGRYWSRDGKTEIDLVAELGGDEAGHLLFCECKWSARTPLGTQVYADLRAAVASLPEASWKQEARLALFSTGGFRPELEALAADPANRLTLIQPDELL